VEWKALESVFNIIAGGDVPKDAFSDVKTQRYNIDTGLFGKRLFRIVWAGDGDLEFSKHWFGKLWYMTSC
jgi:hypothetical protein